MKRLNWAARAPIRANSICCALQHANLSHPRLPCRGQPLEPAAGHAVPTRRALSARRVELTDTMTAGATLRAAKPATLPDRPYFSSGPCAKPPGWSPQALDTAGL